MKNARLMAVCGLLMSTAAATAGEFLLQDNFERPAADGETVLHLQNVGDSDAVWEATSNLFISQNGGVEVTDDGPFVGRVVLPAEGRIITLEASVRPTSKESNPPWVGIGIGSAKLGNPTFGGLYLFAHATGICSLAFNADPNDATSARAITLQSGQIRSWDPDGTNRLRLVYDRESNLASAWVNDELLAEAVNLEENNFSLSCEFAGFSGYGQAPAVRRIGDITMSVSE